MAYFNIDPDITRAETVPSSWYRSQIAFDECLESVFAPSWQVVGDRSIFSSQTAIVPSIILAETLAEPIILVNESDAVSVLSNVCTHRGNLLVETACPLQEIRCRYHGRRFLPNGVCVHMPDFKDVEGFPGPKDNLPKLNSGAWNGLLLASIRNPSLSVETLLAGVTERTGFLGLENASYDLSRQRTYSVNAHWALYVENYLEGFHIPFVHHSLNSVLDHGKYETLPFDGGVLQIGIARQGEVSFVLPNGHPDEGKEVAAWYYFLFPNTMLNVYPWGLSVNIVEPVTKDLTHIHYRTYVLDPTLLGSGAGSGLDAVELEDEAIVEAVQKGMNSSNYSRGRYSPTREQGVHAFHRMLETALNGQSSTYHL